MASSGFEPANELEKSLMEAATDPAYRPQFYRDLLQSDIYVISADPQHLDIRDGVLQKASQINIQPWERNGIKWLPIFSSLPRLQQSIRAETNYLRLNAKSFFEITRGAHVVLNPGLPYGKDLTPSEIERLLDGSIFRPTASHTADKATQVFIGQPAIYPKELVQALVKLLAIDSSVKAAYLAQYHDPEQDQKPHLLIGIDMDGDWEKTLGDAGLVASQFLARDEFVDFVRIDESGVSRYMTDQTKPFYTRSS